MCIIPAVIIGGIVGCLCCGNKNNDRCRRDQCSDWRRNESRGNECRRNNCRRCNDRRNRC